MPLTPVGAVNLHHRAYHILCAGINNVFFVADETGRVTKIDSNFASTPFSGNWGRLHSISVNDGATVLAIAHDHSLTLRDLTSATEYIYDAPSLERPTDSPNMKPGRFHDCFFNGHDNRLWCVAPLSSHQFNVQVRKPANWRTDCEAVVDDPFGGSFCSFYEVPHSDTVALWAAAGQDGQQVFWVRENASLNCQSEPALANTTPPVFAIDGSEFLVLSDDGVICRFEFPDVRKIGECFWPFESAEDEEDAFGCSIAYVGDRHAIVSSNEGRLFLLDVETMTLSRELTIAGHEPRPAEELYPTLAGDRRLGTDLCCFRKHGNLIVTVHRRDSGSGPDGWQDSLLFFPTATLCDSLTP